MTIPAGRRWPCLTPEHADLQESDEYRGQQSGKITSACGDRHLQFALKLVF
jgi:hypothetical protein